MPLASASAAMISRILLNRAAPAFRRSVRLAEDYFSEGLRDGDAATPSVRSLDEAELMGVIGARYRDLSRHDARHAAQAQDYIARAIALAIPIGSATASSTLSGLPAPT